VFAVDHDELSEIMARSNRIMARSNEIMARNEIAFRDLRSFLAEQTLAMRELTLEIRSWRRVDGNGGPAGAGAGGG
jgi:hypothetical protein